MHKDIFIRSPLCSFHNKATFLFSSFSHPSFHNLPIMVPEMEKPRITEIKVRIDCNGCVQKIKKALHGITGIYDIYIDFSEQKITIIGWADPQKIIKAIKKTRKSAIICLHTEQYDQPAQSTESEEIPEAGAAEGGAQPPEPVNPPELTQPTHTEATQQGEEPKEKPNPENPPPEPSNATAQSSKPKDDEQIHVTYHHPPEYGYRYAYGPDFQQGYGERWNAYHGNSGFRGEPSQPPQPINVTHSYNTYKPSAYVTQYAYPTYKPSTDANEYAYHTYKPSPYVNEYAYPTYKPPPYVNEYAHPTYKPSPYVNKYAYPTYKPSPYEYTYPTYKPSPYEYAYPTYKPSPYATEYTYPQSPPRYSQYSRPDDYSRDYYSGNNGNGNITSMFSEENPNACRIV